MALEDQIYDLVLKYQPITAREIDSILDLNNREKISRILSRLFRSGKIKRFRIRISSGRSKGGRITKRIDLGNLPYAYYYYIDNEPVIDFLRERLNLHPDLPRNKKFIYTVYLRQLPKDLFESVYKIYSKRKMKMMNVLNTSRRTRRKSQIEFLLELIEDLLAQEDLDPSQRLLLQGGAEVLKWVLGSPLSLAIFGRTRKGGDGHAS